MSLPTYSQGNGFQSYIEEIAKAENKFYSLGFEEGMQNLMMNQDLLLLSKNQIQGIFAKNRVILSGKLAKTKVELENAKKKCDDYTKYYEILTYTYRNHPNSVSLFFGISYLVISISLIVSSIMIQWPRINNWEDSLLLFYGFIGSYSFSLSYRNLFEKKDVNKFISATLIICLFLIIVGIIFFVNRYLNGDTLFTVLFTFSILAGIILNQAIRIFQNLWILKQAEKNDKKSYDIYVSELRNLTEIETSIDSLEENIKAESDSNFFSEALKIKFSQGYDMAVNKSFLGSDAIEKSILVKNISNAEFGRFRIHFLRNFSVSEISSYIHDLEIAYNRLNFFNDYLFTALNEKKALFNLQSITSHQQLYLLVQNELRVEKISISSPGFWEFLGSLNPLLQIREYLNDRHKRKLDNTYLNDVDEEKKRLENKLLQINVIKEAKQLIDDLNIPEEEKTKIIKDYLIDPLFKLGTHQDNGLIDSMIKIENE